MGKFGLELFKFGTYLAFPIGIMYYFGTNIEERFAVPGFWPSAEQSNTIPKDRDEIRAEYDRIVARQKIRQANLAEQKEREAALQAQTQHDEDSH
ncbi:unnamed protein product [Clonostachys rosea]|uniref:Uncharacterized protein n=1 Tax=Bionectria ochroleuca TaxID=29856 RepID=A0ABY6UDQ2_BIOOC|nr:unnamed protein product [Clonostachys rosea]